MKKSILLIIVILFTTTFFGQSNKKKDNAYLAINQLYQIAKFDSLDFDVFLRTIKYTDSTNAKRIHKFSLISNDTINRWEKYYIFFKSPDSLITIEKIGTLYNELQLYKTKFEDEIKEKQASLIKALESEVKKLSDKIEVTNNELDTITKKIAETEKLSNIAKIQDSIATQNKTIEIGKDDTAIERKGELISKREKLDDKKKELEKKLKRIKDNFKLLKSIAKKIDENQATNLVAEVEQQEQRIDTYLKVSYNIENNSSSFSQKSGFDFPSQTDMVDALAMFVAKRMKQEAILYFFQNFKDDFEKTDLLTGLFPKTYKLFNVNDYNQVPTLGGMWKTAFVNDIVGMPQNIASVNNTNVLSAESQNFYKALAKLSQMYINNTNPIDILYYMKEQKTGSEKFTNLIDFLIIINENFADYEGTSTWVQYHELINMSNVDWEKFFILLYFNNEDFFTKKLSFGFVKKDEFNENVFNKFKLHINDVLMAFNYLDKINKNAQTNIKMGSKDKVEKQNIRAYFNIFISSLDFISAFSTESDKEKIRNYKILFEETRNIYNATMEKNYQTIMLSSINIIEVLLKEIDANKIIISDIENVKGKIEKEVNESISKRIKELTDEDIKTKDLKDIINKIDKLLGGKGNLVESTTVFINTLKLDNENSIIPKDSIKGYIKKIKKKKLKYTFNSGKNLEEFKTAIEKLESLLQNIDSKEATNLIVFKNNILKYHNKKYNKDLQVLFKYSSILIDILNAKNSKQLEEIISSHALPVGSYSLKRTTKFSIELGSFPGLFVGREMETKSYNNKAWVTGFTAPVGISLNWGVKRKFKLGSKSKSVVIREINGKYKYLNGHSFSIMASIIDIGAVVSYRLTNENADGLPEEVKFSQVIAPGAYMIWGLKKAPISIMLGGQLNPMLRNFGNSDDFENMLRFSLGVSMDIPLFRLYFKE